MRVLWARFDRGEPVWYRRCMPGLVWGLGEVWGTGSPSIYLVKFAKITIMALATLLSLIKVRASTYIAFVLCQAQFLIHLSYYDYHHIT